MPSIRRPFPRIVIAALGAIAIGGFGSFAASTAAQSAGTCGLATPAFCDTFDAPAGTGNRSGDLNGTVWGVSRVTTNVNTGQGWYYNWQPTNTQSCGGSGALPDADVRICNGQLVEAVNDGNNDNQTVLAMYPKQPFDIAGRTGTVVFDVGNDTQGGHAAWPEFWYTDQPVPGPATFTSAQALPGVLDTPRNGLGVAFSTVCDSASNQSCYPTNGCPNVHDWTVSTATVVTNYIPSNLPLTQDGCVAAPAVRGQLNHIEIHLSSTALQVYATNAGSSGPLVLLGHANYSSLPLSRGLIWVNDVHYNACKFNSQCDHSFIWDNVGFDGPVLPRDLTFDVPESRLMQPNGTMRLGWDGPNSTNAPLTLTIPGVTNVAQASAALITLTFGAQIPSTAITWSLNGSAWATQPWPFDNQGYAERTIAIPVPLANVLTGNNTLRLSLSQDSAVGNVDLVLVGAGAAPSGTPVPSTSTPASTSTSVPATLTPSATATSAPQTCTVLATLNGVDTRYTRPLSFCTNQ